MKIWSFNCRDLVNPSKNSSLKISVDSSGLDISFLQETMGNSQLVKNTVEALLLSRNFEAVNASVVISCRSANVWGLESRMGMEVFVEELGKSLTPINIYRSYQERV